MLKPTKAVAAIPNRGTILNSLESHTDQVLALELTTDEPVLIVYNGLHFHQMKWCIRQFTTLYSKYYKVLDKTGARKLVYVLEFTPVIL